MKKNLLYFFGTLFFCVLSGSTVSAQDSPLCDKEIVHLGIPAESHTKVALTVTNIDANTVSISIEKIGDLDINSLTVETTIGTVTGSGDASKFEATLSSATPPETFTINALLWNGFIIRPENYSELADIPFNATCGGAVSYNLNLSTLTVNGVAITDFSPSKTAYNVELPFGTTTAPVVAATASNSAYTPIIVQATSPTGTATVTVKSTEDPTKEKVFTINFSVSTVDPANNTECSGISNEVQEGGSYNYSYLFQSTDVGVVITSELLEPKDGTVAYVFDYTAGAPQFETGMTLLEGRKFTQTLPYTTANEKITVAVKFAYAGGLTVTKRFEYTVGEDCGTTGIDTNKSSQLSFYPNPVKDFLNISAQSDIAEVSIYNTLGQLVKTVKSNNSNLSISISSLPVGQYIVIVQTVDGEEITGRIIKK